MLITLLCVCNIVLTTDTFFVIFILWLEICTKMCRQESLDSAAQSELRAPNHPHDAIKGFRFGFRQSQYQF